MSSFTPDPEEQRARRRGIVALVFVVLSLATLYLPPPQQREVAGALRATVLRPFLAVQAGVGELRIQAAEAARLQREADSLAAALVNRTALEEENRTLRELLGLSRRLESRYRAASVLRAGTSGSESMFLVDLGRRDGVREGAPVVVEGGLVGVIREVGEATATGMDWTHPDFRASAMSEEGAAYGIVEPRRGDFREEDRLLLDGVPDYAELDSGTVVMTSGRGGVYPRGIPIGTVESLAEREGGWRKAYWLRPGVRVGSVTHVLVQTGVGGGGEGAAAWGDGESVWEDEGRREATDTVGAPVPDSTGPGTPEPGGRG